MELTIYQVDAFADRLFHGNPAAICVLDAFLPDILMQAIAGELNLSETAFVVPKGEDYRIRWFTPLKEVSLCGHATLAAAHTLYQHYGRTGALRFHSLSGWLTTEQTAQGIEMDFPLNRATPIPLPTGIESYLGGCPQAAMAGEEDLIIIYSDASEVSILEPDFNSLKKLPYRGFIATAPSPETDVDFVCRFFAPAYGINEDPVTGSAYTVLTPYFANRLNKSEMRARQLSRRGGNLSLRLAGERVKIAGSAITTMHATFYLADLDPL